ncbi:BamA/TamA family outer membrane protein [Rhodocytophaga rosea]|uniref:BamA/TamA family outer membrane protein n=1 Tax=Rhodocytophaga rosea TaxID=2704465 RepID=A0A6C0GV17_9BACT|nr:POTRA domain-containing protein [Rhodocytophaga rosea]QHT71403.1 BamA/TamA family outer membrane protein [Rhodocytophaga rosea]
MLSGCLNKEKLLRKNEFLLYSQKIEGNDKIATDDLEPFYRQQSNKRILNLPIMPYLWIYYQGSKLYNEDKVKKNIERVKNRYNDRIAAADVNSGKYERLKHRRDRKLDKYETQLEEGNFWMRIGEPPVVFDSLLSKQAAEQMRFYATTKGYFDATSSYSFKLDTARRTAKVVYKITENQPYKIQDTSYVVDNSHIDSLLRASVKNSPIKPGDIYDEDNLNLERERIDKLLKNNGYFNFNRQYVEYRIISDTVVTDALLNKIAKDEDKLVEVETVVNKPAGQAQHTLYKLDDIYFTTDANTPGGRIRAGRRDTVEYEGVHYIGYNTKRFSKKILNAKLLMRPGDLYSLQRTIETQRVLSSLDIFKFANVYYDTTGNKFTARINASPLEKYTVSDEWGVTVSQQLPGPFVDLTFKSRNVFGGLEVFETSVSAGIIGQAGYSDNNQVYASQEINATASLVFPQIFFPTKVRFKFNRYSPRTRLLAGFNFNNRPEYRRVNLKAGMNYTFQKDIKHSFTISPVDLNLIYTPSVTAEFDTTLRKLKDQGSNLYRSFQRSFVSSLSGTYTYNDNITGQTKEARYIRAFAESGGTTLNILDWADPSFRGDSLQGAQLYRYFKLSNDFRYYLPAGRKSSWAFRVNVGIARPYGQSTVLPYERFFFVGGSNSIRAWPPAV